MSIEKKKKKTKKLKTVSTNPIYININQNFNKKGASRLTYLRKNFNF